MPRRRTRRPSESSPGRRRGRSRRRPRRERRRAWRDPARVRLAGSAPGSCIAARPAVDQREALRRSQPKRLGEQAGDADVHRVAIDEHVDQFVDERRDAAHGSELELGGDLLGGHRERGGDLGQGDLTPLHQPRQDDEQATQARLCGPLAAPRCRAHRSPLTLPPLAFGAAMARSRATNSSRTALGDSTSA